MKKLDSESFERLFNLSLDMLCIASPEGYFTSVNPSFSRVLKYSEDELLSRPITDFVHPDDTKKTIEEISKLNDGKDTTSFENRYLTKSGETRVFSWSASSDPKTGKIYAAARDVTDLSDYKFRLKQLEKTLDEETIIAHTDKNGVITFVNDRFCKISGYSSEELVGKTHKVVNSGNHPKEFFKNLWNTISSGSTWTGLINNRRKDGSEYYVQSIITPIYNIHDQFQHYLAIRFDVTDEINAKDNHRKVLDILNETGSIAKVGGWELEVATGELTWTDETFRILEVEKKADQKPILPEGLQLFVDEHKPIIERAVERATTLGEPYSLELQAKTAKGNVLWVYTNGKANYKDGKIVTLSGTIQDINAQKLAELNFEKERAKSIQNSKLAAIGELAAGVAHEINNPMAIIRGSTQLIEKFKGDPEKLQSKIDSIVKSCDRVSHIVQSLQKFAHSNGQEERKSCSLNEIVKEAISLANFKAARHKVLISFETETTTPNNIFCDEVEIEQVMINLINNSIYEVKDKEERWIKIQLSKTPKFIEARVIDSGNGIPENAKERLFEPFYTTKNVGEGTGLGLSITKGILDEHDANIYLDDSNPNTCFVIQFPITENPENVH